MDAEIQIFLESLSQIGKSDDSLYDTVTKDIILKIVIDQPYSKDFIQSNSLALANETELNALQDAVFDLLVAFENSTQISSPELSIRNYVKTLPIGSDQRIRIDEIFGDYFDEEPKGKKVVNPLIRRIFFSGKCYLAFMLTPALITGVLIYFIYPQAYAGMFIIAVMICCFIAMLVGIILHDFLNKKIQQYEGVIE